MKRYIFIIVFVSNMSISYAQYPFDAISISMSYISVSSPHVNMASFHNPSWLHHHQSKISLSVNRYYNLIDFSEITFHGQQSFSWGGVGLGIASFGTSDLFKETQLSIGYAYDFGIVRVGLAGRYIHINQGGDYPSFAQRSVNVGISAPINNQLYLASTLYHIVSVGQVDDITPTAMAFGVAYQPHKVSQFYVELYKEELHAVDIRMGSEIHLHKVLTLRSGVGIEPVRYSYGMGLDMSYISVDMGLLHHYLLGLSMSFQVVIPF